MQNQCELGVRKNQESGSRKMGRKGNLRQYSLSELRRCPGQMTKSYSLRLLETEKPAPLRLKAQVGKPGNRCSLSPSTIILSQGINLLLVI